jgi:DNA-binding transcriptional ArsR family regulator
MKNRNEESARTSPSESRDRDQQILNRLARIEHKVDSLEQTTAFALRAEADKHFASVKEIFRAGKRRAQVYLAADGTRSVQDLASHLRMKGPNVSRELSKLAGEGLLEIVDSDGGKDFWGKKPVDRTLRISQFLIQTYSLERDGRPGRASKKTARRGREQGP